MMEFALIQCDACHAPAIVVRSPVAWTLSDAAAHQSAEE
jgi:hypothetical protein